MNFLTTYLTNEETSEKKDLAILLLVFGVAFFQFLGRIPLINPDEARYAEIPREMLEHGDFITPMLNYVKFFDKPPLHYWLSALSMTIFGQNEFAARFTGAAMGLLTVLLVYHAGRRLFGRREGIMAALILGASTGFLVQARYNVTDMTLTCTLSATLAFFILAAREGEPRKGLYYHLFYLFAGLAMLAKGLIGIVFPGAIIFLYLLITGRWRIIKEMRLATGIPLFLLVCAPWFILVSIRNPEFARYFFIHEHFERFTTTVHHRKQGFWFYIPVLLGTMLPWSFFIPSAFRGVWRERMTAEGSGRLYLVIWAAFIFLFFSKSSSQLVPYILPVFPPLALLIGVIFARFTDGFTRPLKIESYTVAGFLTTLGAAAISYPHFAPRPELPVIGCTIIGGIFFLEGLITFRNISRGSPALLFAGLLLCSYVLGIAGPPFVLARAAEKKSDKDLALIINDKAGRYAMIASFGPHQGLTFYTGKRVAIIGKRAEFEFGSQQGDQTAWFPDLQRFAEVWDSPTPVFTVLSENDLKSLQGIVHIPPRIITRREGKVLITNH